MPSIVLFAAFYGDKGLNMVIYSAALISPSNLSHPWGVTMMQFRVTPCPRDPIDCSEGATTYQVANRMPRRLVQTEGCFFWFHFGVNSIKKWERKTNEEHKNHWVHVVWSSICVIHCDMSCKHFFKGTKWRGNGVTIPLVKKHGLTNHGMFDTATPQSSLKLWQIFLRHSWGLCDMSLIQVGLPTHHSQTAVKKDGIWNVFHWCLKGYGLFETVPPRSERFLVDNGPHFWLPTIHESLLSERRISINPARGQACAGTPPAHQWSEEISWWRLSSKEWG